MIWWLGPTLTTITLLNQITIYVSIYSSVFIVSYYYYLFILIDVNTDILDKYSMCRLQMCSDFDSIFYWTLSSKLDLIAGKVIARSVGLMQYSTLLLENKILALGSFTLNFTEL